MAAQGIEDTFGLVGSLLEGQFRVEAVVGAGGFGTVYRAHHLVLDQPVAIKVLKGLDAEDPRINELVLEKFREEARLLYKLSQSSLNIVRSLDYGAVTTPSGIWAPFMVLEWLEGKTLAVDLEERRRAGMRGRSLNETLALLAPAAEGLSIAHQRQVAHRDIKPANLFMLAARGSTGPTVKVLDFGIAKIMKEGETVGTRGTFASFTWLYAAPEQLDPRVGPTGLATDVYGFGLVLTELLTDRAPVEGRDTVTILKAGMDRNLRPTPRTRGADVSDAVEAVCRRALAVDPRERFGTVTEMWGALTAAHEGGLVSVAGGGKGRTVAVASAQLVPPKPRAFTAPVASIGAGPAPTPKAKTALVAAIATPRAITPAQPHPPSAPHTGWNPPNPAPPTPGSNPHHVGTGLPRMPYPPQPQQPPQPPPPQLPVPPPAAAGGGNTIVIVTAVAVVLALLFAGTCGVIHSCAS